MRTLVFLILTMILSACDPMVVFTEPQPEGGKDLRSFPAKFRGTFMELDDSSIFIITTTRILEQYEATLADPEGEILEEGDIELAGDTLIIKEMNLKFPITRKNDSVFGSVMLYDTIFDIQREGKLRKSGRNYLLNLPSDDEWIVLKMIVMASGKAYHCGIAHEKEIDIFKQHCTVDTETNEDGKPRKYILSTTPKELRKLLKLKTFTDTTEYIRVSKEVPW